MGKSIRNKKRAMENLNLFYQDIGTSSSAGGHLTQEEAAKEALAIRISRKFALLEEERPLIETMSYHDKYKKVLDEIWKDKVELDVKIVKEEEEAVKRIKGVTTLIAKFLILDIPIDRDAPILVGWGFLRTIGGIVNTLERLFSTFDGFCHQTFHAARSDVMRNAESDSEDEKEYQIKRNKFGAPIYGPKPAPYLNCNDPTERSLAIQTVTNPLWKISVRTKALPLFGFPARIGLAVIILCPSGPPTHHQAQQLSAPQHIYQLASPQQFIYPQGSDSYIPGNYAYMPNVFQSQTTMPPQEFQSMTPQDPSWSMDTGASSHLADNTANVNVVRSMWLFKHKFNANGSLSRYKARLVANGRIQQQGINYDETSSLVVKPATIRTILSLAVSRDWPIHQLDVKNAFLHSHLSETVYMHQPPGFIDHNKPNYVCHLQQSLYGLKQAPHAWFQRFASYATRVTSSLAFLQRIIDSLHTEFAMKDLGSLNYFLGISAQRSTSGLTPMDTESKLGSDGNTVSDPTLYRSLAGALQYLTFTRPDISYVVQRVCLYMHDPREPHSTALKNILRYVCGTVAFGLQLHASSTAQLTAYTDVDWAGCPVTLSWSSAEAEYLGVANVVVETAWLRNLLLELHAPLTTTTLVYCDNVSVVYLSTNLVQHQGTKHIKIDIHFVRDYVASSQVRVLHVPSRFQYADIFTKGLPSALFCDFRSSLNV
ncbi:ribonuclease H-like domain-containing protein [Tanacetum coccineum]